MLVWQNFCWNLQEKFSGTWQQWLYPLIFVVCTTEDIVYMRLKIPTLLLKQKEHVSVWYNLYTVRLWAYYSVFDLQIKSCCPQAVLRSRSRINMTRLRNNARQCRADIINSASTFLKFYFLSTKRSKKHSVHQKDITENYTILSIN
jgi:hypothetical protein